MHSSACDLNRVESGPPSGLDRLLSRRRASMLVLTPVIVVAILSVALLAVEWGRIQVARAELQTAADAAAMAAAGALGTEEDAVALAVAAAGENTVLGQPLQLSGSLDVSYGNWDPKTGQFTPVPSANAKYADSIRVTARRSASRGSPVPLLLGQIIGIDSVDVAAEAIAYKDALYTGLIGIDYVNLDGTVNIDSYVAADSSYGDGKRESATVMSNGPITIGSNVTVGGDVRPGPGYAASGGTVKGDRAPLPKAVNWPPVTASEYASGYDNSPIAHLMNGPNLNVSSQDVITLPAGTYLIKNLNLSGGARLHATGPVKIFVTGLVNLTGGSSTATGSPMDLEIRVVGKGQVSMAGNSDYYGHIYAPESKIELTGTNAYYGMFVGKSLDMSGTADAHHDESARRGFGSRLVR